MPSAAMASAQPKHSRSYTSLIRTADAAEAAKAARASLIERHNIDLRRPDTRRERTFHPPESAARQAHKAGGVGKGVWFRTNVVTAVHDAHPRAEYDRRSEPLKQCTRQKRARIANRLNYYKRHEMRVHTKSRKNTLYHPVASSWWCCPGSGLRTFAALARGFRRVAV